MYDVGGNIVSKTEYEFTEVSDLSTLTATDTITYSYDSVWKDKLEYFNDVKIKYDEIGNPKNYVKKDVIDESSELGTLSWNGRQLESVIVGDSTYKYSYDADGLRTKTEMYDSAGDFNGAIYYLWRDGKLSGYTNVNSDGETEQTIKMLFDNTGESVGYTCYNATNNSEETFYFGKNVFGDIITVYSDDGDALVTYTYDAWGCVTAKAHGTSASQIIAAIVALMFTPITYRGYNYDLNTGLYYLQSRYYNPAYGRFLNADSIIKTGDIHGANVFAYCNNNPVKNVDYNGHSAVSVITQILRLLIVYTIVNNDLGSDYDWIFSNASSFNYKETTTNGITDIIATLTHNSTEKNFESYDICIKLGSVEQWLTYLVDVYYMSYGALEADLFLNIVFFALGLLPFLGTPVSFLLLAAEIKFFVDNIHTNKYGTFLYNKVKVAQQIGSNYIVFVYNIKRNYTNLFGNRKSEIIYDCTEEIN